MTRKIFVNYRRTLDVAVAGRLHDRLSSAIGPAHTFMDVNNIPVGVDFTQYLHSRLLDCVVLLAVIGPGWLSATDAAGHRRLDRADDFVAAEIAFALNRGCLVIPVLVDEARMPRVDDLPEPLKPLALRNAFHLRNAYFASDCDQLIARLRPIVGGEKKRLSNAILLSGLLALGLGGGFAAFNYFGLSGEPKATVEGCDSTLGSTATELPFSGVYAGTVDDGQRIEVQIKLVRNGNSVQGSYLRDGLCGPIFGEVDGDRFLFNWRWTSASGRGAATQEGQILRATSGYDQATEGAGKLELHRR